MGAADALILPPSMDFVPARHYTQYSLTPIESTVTRPDYRLPPAQEIFLARYLPDSHFPLKRQVATSIVRLCSARRRSLASCPSYSSHHQYSALPTALETGAGYFDRYAGYAGGQEE